jgi:uncharacterized membrane protein YkoI
MLEENMTTGPPGRRRVGLAVGMLAAGAVAGVVLAGTLNASAADSSSGTSTSGAGAPSSTTRQDGGAPAGTATHSSSPVRGDEKALTASSASKVKAAALKAVPGGTVYRVETDAGDGAYEAHMTKSDGSEVTVKLDKDFNVTRVEGGMGKGDPQPSGQPRNPSHSSSSSTGAA